MYSVFFPLFYYEPSQRIFFLSTFIFKFSRKIDNKIVSGHNTVFFFSSESLITNLLKEESLFLFRLFVCNHFIQAQ